MNSSVLKEVQKQIKLLTSKYPAKINENEKHNDGTIEVDTIFFTPKEVGFDTAFLNQVLRVRFAITPNYPNSSPSVSLEPNKIWHVNVKFDDGAVCVSILNSDWKSLKDKSLLYIVDEILPAFIVQQNPNDPLNSKCKAQSSNEQRTTAAQLLKSNQLTLEQLEDYFGKDRIPEYTRSKYESITQVVHPTVFGRRVGHKRPAHINP